jgi:hypothetical protein
MSSDGYRSFSYLQRNTYYLKYVQPLGQNTSFDGRRQLQQHQVQQPGHGHAGADQPIRAQLRVGQQSLSIRTNNYYPYNYQQKQADFEYIGLKAKLGERHRFERQGLHVLLQQRQPRKLDRSGGRRHDKIPGNDCPLPPMEAFPTPTTPPTPSPTRERTSHRRRRIASNDDPGGRIKVNAYRALGDYLALSHGDDTTLEEKVGIWGEYVKADRYSYDLDYSPAYLAANPEYAYRSGAFDPSSGYKNNALKAGLPVAHARLSTRHSSPTPT